MKDAFGPWLREEAPDCWHVDYGGLTSCDIYVADDPDRIAQAMISRPVPDERLWESVFKILLLGNAMLVGPGCKGPVIAREATIPCLPEGIAADMGAPRCVTSGRAIAELIRSD